MERSVEELRGGAVSSRGWLSARPRWALALGSLATLSLAGPARAELGVDLDRLEGALSRLGRVERLAPRLLEREERLTVMLPSWALDPSREDCTTVSVLAPARTHFVLHFGPGSGIAPGASPSSGGAVALTRCGRERLSLFHLLLEMRSPRVVVHTLVSASSEPPKALNEVLPGRDAGPAAAGGDAGPPLPPLPLADVVRLLTRRATRDGASSTQVEPFVEGAELRLSLSPGCHRLTIASSDPETPYVVLMRERDEDRPEVLEPSPTGEASTEICSVRQRALRLVTQSPASDVKRSAVLSRFALPEGLPTRFGPEIAEGLATALGGSMAPRRLGWLVASGLGAQGLTPLPRELLPATCYLAAATVLHGEPRALSLVARAQGAPREAQVSPTGAGPRLAFCTGQSGHVELEVEARGAGVAWMFALFRVGPATAVAP